MGEVGAAAIRSCRWVFINAASGHLPGERCCPCPCEAVPCSARQQLQMELLLPLSFSLLFLSSFFLSSFFLSSFFLSSFFLSSFFLSSFFLSSFFLSSFSPLSLLFLSSFFPLPLLSSNKLLSGMFQCSPQCPVSVLTETTDISALAFQGVGIVCCPRAGRVNEFSQRKAICLQVSQVGKSMQNWSNIWSVLTYPATSFSAFFLSILQRQF